MSGGVIRTAIVVLLACSLGPVYSLRVRWAARGVPVGSLMMVRGPTLTSLSCPIAVRHGLIRGGLYSTPQIISPFDISRGGNSDERTGYEEVGEAKATKSTEKVKDDDDEPLALTMENVELVLESMRPYLKADGGNVRLAEIDGPVVKLELQGACGSCPSSAMTMKMGLERKLKQRIPEISEVIQTIPDAPQLNESNLETVLQGVRPFLKVAGGSITVADLTGVGGLQPTVVLDLQGTAAALQSVKTEIVQRIQRHFMMGIKVEWK